MGHYVVEINRKGCSSPLYISQTGLRGCLTSDPYRAKRFSSMNAALRAREGLPPHNKAAAYCIPDDPRLV